MRQFRPTCPRVLTITRTPTPGCRTPISVSGKNISTMCSASGRTHWGMSRDQALRLAVWELISRADRRAAERMSRFPAPTRPIPTGAPMWPRPTIRKRPRHRFWFGPMTLIQFLSDTGRLPGTAHDISMVAAKLGVAGALTDIQNNHPNDLVAMLLFNRPPIRANPVKLALWHSAILLGPKLHGDDQRPLVSTQ